MKLPNLAQTFSATKIASLKGEKKKMKQNTLNPLWHKSHIVINVWLLLGCKHHTDDNIIIIIIKIIMITLMMYKH